MMIHLKRKINDIEIITNYYDAQPQLALHKCITLRFLILPVCGRFQLFDVVSLFEVESIVIDLSL